MRIPSILAAATLLPVVSAEGSAGPFDFETMPRFSDLAGQAGWVVSDKTDIYSAIISNVMINIDTPNLTSKALNFGDASISTYPPSETRVTYSHAAQGTLANADTTFDFLIEDSQKVTFENRDVFGFSFSGPSGPVLAVEFVPTQPASTALSTLGDGQWSLHCRIGSGPRQPIQMNFVGGAPGLSRSVFEARRHDFVMTLSPNAGDPSLTDLALTIRNIDPLDPSGTGFARIVGATTLSLDPNTPIHAFHLDWKILEGNTRFGSNSFWIDNLAGPFRDGKVPAPITFAGLSRVYDGTARAVSASTVPAGLPVTLTYNGSPTPPTGAGSYTVAATILDPAYEGSAQATLVIEKASQSITFDPMPDQLSNAAPISLSASSGSGLGVGFSIVSGPATIVGSTLTLSGGIGTVVVRAEQSGDANYHPALPVERSFVVTFDPASYEAWALANFGDAHATLGEATQDPDGDGQTNRAEWLARTNPRDGMDRFEAAVVADGNRGLVVRWFGRSGVFYRVCRSEDGVTWSELSGSRRTGADALAECADPIEAPPMGSSRRFYRVETVVP